MFRSLLKLLLLLTMFAATDGFGAQPDISTLYETRLAPAYEKLAPLKDEAAKRKKYYIFLALAALVLFVLAVKFLQLRGAIAVILIVAAAITYLKKSEPLVSRYQEKFKEEILTPIAESVGGYRFTKGTMSPEDLKRSRFFGPSVEVFRASDLYTGDGVRFGYLHIDFNTKENEAAERFDDNVFDGIMIEIDRPNTQRGVMIGRKLADAVALQNLSMREFFADMKRAGEKGGYSLFGEVDEKALEKMEAFSDMPVGVSFQKDKTYILLYTGGDPLAADPLENFDLKKARRYAETFRSVQRLIETFR